MDYAIEALFKAMMSEGWFIATDGEVEAPTGFFGYTNQTEAELSEIYEGFSDVIEAYGTPPNSDIVGSFFAHIDSNGIIWISKMKSQEHAKRQFDKFTDYYNKWSVT